MDLDPQTQEQLKFTFCSRQHLMTVTSVPNHGDKQELSAAQFLNRLKDPKFNLNDFFVRFSPSELEREIGPDKMREQFLTYLELYQNGLQHKIVSVCESCQRLNAEDHQRGKKQDSKQKSAQKNNPREAAPGFREVKIIPPCQVSDISLGRNDVGLEKNNVLSIEQRFISDYYLCPNCSRDEKDNRLMKLLQKESCCEFVFLYCR